MKKYILIGIYATFILSMSACRKFLNVVPDDVATLDNAFATRIEAEKFLFTCYSGMPKNGNVTADPAMLGGDEIWMSPTSGYYYTSIALGFQNVVNPYGSGYWSELYQSLRDCNIFLQNIDKVPNMDETEKRRWIAEVKFLKAYYHFYLLKMYGPIPLMKKNIPISANAAQVQVFRAPVDSCFNYIIALINEAEPYLPLTIGNPVQELGRITQPIALSFKAKVLVYAASPLFNGNIGEAALKNPDGTQLFNQTFSRTKWDSAVIACKQAIDICQSVGMKLYYYQPAFQQYDLSDTIMTQLSIRNSVCERWNSGVIWANTQTNSGDLQRLATTLLDPKYADNPNMEGLFSPPLKIAEMFYTHHGVPITQDKTWGYANRYSLQTAGDSESLYIRKGYTSAHLNFDRGPRFYADLGFDGGVWYGQGYYNDKDDMNLLYIQAKYRQLNGSAKENIGTVTGYFIKKLIDYQNVIGVSTYSVNAYPWPMMRLAGLYLLYAEALNEAQGPVPDVYKYINMVRERAGLQSVQTSWSNYSNNPSEYTTQAGMRKIIHQERLIELAFEGQRFWDLRRWKEASAELNAQIQGWNLKQEDAGPYYKPKTIFNQTFGSRDYFWPISESTLEDNKNLIQNLGW